MKHLEKTNEYLFKIGKTLKEQREIVSKKSIDDFCKIMSEFSGLTYSNEIINKMESGDGNISIIYWINVWQYYQNIDKIIKAYDAKEMMYLAQQEFLPQIEQEIIDFHKKEKNNS